MALTTKQRKDRPELDLCERIAPIIGGQDPKVVVAMCCETMLFAICSAAADAEAAHEWFDAVMEAMHQQIDQECPIIQKMNAEKEPH